MVSSSQSSLQLSWLRRYMYELGRVVPIVPVVCKSDCMTVAEQACPAEEEVFLAIRYSQAEQGSWRLWCAGLLSARGGQQAGEPQPRRLSWCAQCSECSPTYKHVWVHMLMVMPLGTLLPSRAVLKFAERVHCSSSIRRERAPAGVGLYNVGYVMLQCARKVYCEHEYE